MSVLNARVTAEPNGWPEFKPYRYRARRPAWMLTAIAAAEAQHGPPVPTCVCGTRLALNTRDETTWACPACGDKPGGRPKAASMP